MQTEEEILSIIKRNNLLDISEVWAYSKYSKKAFENSEHYNNVSINECIERNIIRTTVDNRNAWLASESATLQIKAMQLVVNSPNFKRLTGNDLEKTEGTQLKLFEVEIL